MRPRSVGRRLALQYLFMADMNHYDNIEAPGEFFQAQRRAILENTKDREDDNFIFDNPDPYQDEAESFALRLIREVRENQNGIDAAIEKATSNWSISRMGIIERNAIRIAAAELRQGESPRGVILNEAVDLAKRFGDKESGAFVNGIADRLASNEPVELKRGDR